MDAQHSDGVFELRSLNVCGPTQQDRAQGSSCLVWRTSMDRGGEWRIRSALCCLHLLQPRRGGAATRFCFFRPS